MEEAFKNNHQYKWLRELPGWCYMALVKPEYAYSYHLLAYPTVTQLVALPKQMCNNSEGAQIVSTHAWILPCPARHESQKPLEDN